ncbi:MAG: MFS transporter [Actinomycetia bacterium]|nr:MFS transporter [Actinomycetes bacterium]MCP4959166.1 MFS transporter [Actinomycetes bacterium]
MTEELTAWDGAPGLVILGFGLPALLLSLPAGSLSDRTDQRRLIIRMSLAGAAVMATTAAIVASGHATPRWATAVGMAAGAAMAMMSPALQAAIPRLVEPELLMNGVALGSMAMNVSLMAGAVVGGVTIDLFNIETSFLLMGAILLAAAWLMHPVHIPGPSGVPPDRRGAVRAGLRLVANLEPVRSLIVCGLVISIAGALVQISMPDIVRDDIGLGATPASLLNLFLGVGMFITTAFIASRTDLAHRGLWMAVTFSSISGSMMVAMGMSSNYLLSAAAMFVWGLGGGIVLTLQRTLIQEHTPSEYMGRIMGVLTLTTTGSLPMAAALTSWLNASLGPPRTLAVTGVFVSAAAAAITMRPAVRTSE